MQKHLRFLAFLVVSQASAQCPYYSTCPVGTQLYCDYSNNDPLFWKSAPQTWNPGLMLTDLPEGNVDLGIVARDSCGGQNISVSYTLFLDLDGNDTAETVIKSNAGLPPGKVLFNNVSSPNYTTGDTIAFDHRTGLADSMKYSFGLELNRIADLVIANLKWTTGIENLNYSTPKLPLGKHHIVWRIEQGGVERFCAYGFEVKDCAPPLVMCATMPMVDLLPTGNISLWASDFVESANDNITPSNLLVLAVRKYGTGIGFPLDDQGNPQNFVTFDCCALGAQGVEVWVKDKQGLISQCTTYVIIQDGMGNCPADGCAGGYLSACSKTELSDEVEEMRYVLEVTPVSLPSFSRIDSIVQTCGFFEFIPLNSDLVLTPSKNDNPLNGVTTYDLVLMSKHILGIESLNTPYKIIAADANKSGSITTFDIVEIRKIILGINSTFPNNTSWRFTGKDFQFTNAQNPFQTVFPEHAVLQDWLGFPNNIDFEAIKIGDVNNTAIPNASTPAPAEARSPSFLALPDMELRAGETLELPIQATEDADWLGLQLSFDFDPALLEMLSVESAVLPGFDQNNWAQSRPGRLNLSWSAAVPTNISRLEDLFHLRIKARTALQLSSIFKTPEHAALHAEAYDSAGVVWPLQVVFAANNPHETAQIFVPQPNPTTADVRLPIQLLQTENLQLEISDLSGKLIWMNDLRLEKGNHVLEIPALAMPDAGVYVWKIKAGQMRRTGKIVRI